ncbi:MAG: RluA family pseudouridine synthase [Candidatus Shikimatogenerans bostrichidophilus]|nr:MAG: RluA family pseudouridine synthase [Candidatus Shikimatogenerans bostrichidophilus]
MQKIIINNNKKTKIRLDKFLFIYLFKNKKFKSRQTIQNDIKKGKILLNNHRTKKNKIIKLNDKIKYYYKKKHSINKNNTPNYIYPNKKIQVNIHYEDDNILIINKNPGLIVHPGCGNYRNTLINWVKYYFYKNKINYNLDLNYLSNNRYGLLHRLDKNTSGLLIMAKNIKYFNSIKNQFLNKTIKKKYIALIWGIPKTKKNIIKNYIGRNKKNRIKMMVKNNKKDGKYSITQYKILKTFKFFSLIECTLETGRTHQIRVHMKYIGHPIFNDNLYGGNKIINNIIKHNYKKYVYTLFTIIKRHALHAYYLKYEDPITKNNKSFKAKLPKDIKNGIKFLNKNF